MSRGMLRVSVRGQVPAQYTPAGRRGHRLLPPRSGLDLLSNGPRLGLLALPRSPRGIGHLPDP